MLNAPVTSTFSNPKVYPPFKSANHRFEVLDIFRGLFASLVFIYHLAPLTQTVLFSNPFVEHLDIFVDFFFVLSGFVIAYRYRTLDSYHNFAVFFRKRFLRLYPLHLVMLLAFVSLEGIKVVVAPYVQVNQLNNPHNNIYTFISSLLLLNSTSLLGAEDMSWNIPSWSISAEMIAYVVFGLTALLLNSTKNYACRNVCYGLVMLLSIASLVLTTGEFKLSYGYNYGFLRGIIGFFTGVLCFNLYQSVHRSWSRLHTSYFSLAEVISVLFLLAAVWQGSYLKPVGLLYEPIFFLCILIFAFEKGFVSQKLKRTLILHNVGKYSYSIYLTHAFINCAFNVLFIRVLHFPPSAYLYLCIPNYALVYGFSAWTYRHIEIQFQTPGQIKKLQPRNVLVALSNEKKI